MRSIQAPTVFVHTGTVKTGSTYIQKAFYDNRTVFERFGVSYPTVSPLTVYRTEREPYRPVDMQEVEMLMNGILSRKG